MPDSFRNASALRAIWRGSRLKSLPVTGSTMFAMTLSVGIAEIDGERTVLPGAEHIDELQVDHLNLVLFREGKKLVRCHGGRFLLTPPKPCDTASMAVCGPTRYVRK